MTFLDFAQAELAAQDKVLSPAQAILGAVLFDGADPEVFAGHPETATLFGAVKKIPLQARRTVVACIGARSGKSFLLGALYAAYRAQTADLSGLARGEQAVAAIVSKDMRLARHALAYVRGLSIPQRDADRDCIEIPRSDGPPVRIECLPASVGGAALRGRWYVSALLDECAFFRDPSTGAVNDRDLYQALLPRILPGGSVVLSSTPWLKTGLHYETFARNRDEARDAVAVFAPTTLMLPHLPQLLADIDSLRSTDPETAAREYDCVWPSTSHDCLFDGLLIDAALIRGAGAQPAPDRVVCGIDLASRHDFCAFVAIGEHPEGTTVLRTQTWRPQPGAPILMRDVVPVMCTLAKAHGATTICSDGWGADEAIAIAADHGITLEILPGGANGKAECYSRLREALATMAIPPEHSLLADQMRRTTTQRLPGGETKIVQHRTRHGGHGDVVSAATAAAWQLCRTPDERRAAANWEAWGRVSSSSAMAVMGQLGGILNGQSSQAMFLSQLRSMI